MGTTLLSKLQLGAETTPGTAVPATFIWAGQNTRLSDERKIGQSLQWVGTLLPSARRYIASHSAKITIPETTLTFEQVCHLFEMGIMTATPEEEGSGYLRAYVFPTAGANTIKTYTAECGDDVSVWRAPYVFAERIEIKGAAEEAWTVSADLRGRGVTAGSFTSLNAPTGLEDALFQLSSLYLDDSGGSIGGTQIRAAFVGLTLTIDTGLRPLFSGDGALHFTLHRQVGPKITGTLSLEHDSATKAELAAAQEGAVRLFRLDVKGSALSTPGSTFSTKALRVDMAIQYTAVPSLADREGNTIIELPFEAVDSDALVPTITVVNNEATL